MRTLTTSKIVVALSLTATLLTETARASSDTTVNAPVIDMVARTVCDRPIVMLGESSHGDGKTITFKVKLTKKLINQCGFNAVYFEAGIYDFLDINNRIRAGQTVTPEMISASMGWIRNQYIEFAPLIPFLHQAAIDRSVTLGGLDDQLGARGAYYSNDQMLKDLSDELATDKQQICYAKLKQWVWYDFPEDNPYTIKDRPPIERCLTEIETAIKNKENKQFFEGKSQLAMIASFRRVLGRGFIDPKTYAPKRDRSMFLNFERLKGQLPADSKTIIWSVNAHVAREPSTAQAFQHGRNLGAYIAEKYGNQAFTLGFSSAGGSYRWSRGIDKPVPIATARSLEYRAFEGTDTAASYLNHNRLTEIGAAPSTLFKHLLSTDDWSSVFDGIVVFREEHPPTPIINK